jgi:membrane associated rhomboid family serine protease
MPLPEKRPAPSPFLTAAVVVISLITFFIWQLGFGVDESIAAASFAPRDWTARAPHRYEHYALSTFMHGGLFHVLVNMAVLWLFGSQLERVLGRGRLALIYLVACYLGLRAHVLFDAKSALPMVGAGGAISGVLGAWLAIHRRQGLEALLPDRLPEPIVRAPVWVLVPLWLGLQALSHAASTAHRGGAPAYAELTAGFLAGVAIGWVVKPNRRKSGARAPNLELG